MPDTAAPRQSLPAPRPPVLPHQVTLTLLAESDAAALAELEIRKREHLMVGAPAREHGWFTAAGQRPGDSELVQGAGGGVATAAIMIGRATGLRVWVTSRDPGRGERALELGAHRVFAAGERLPGRVDAVLDSVGAATWSHSVNALRPGGRLVTVGTTSGAEPPSAELTKIFFKPLQVVGSTMGTRDELAAVLQLVESTGLRPLVDRVLPLSDAAAGLAALAAGEVFGKVVLEP